LSVETMTACELPHPLAGTYAVPSGPTFTWPTAFVHAVLMTAGALNVRPPSQLTAHCCASPCAQ
jgi:hypothetical protein